MFLFFPFLGQSHLFDWDEINFAEAAREMIVTGDYLRVQINFQMFWEKPPFFIWLQVLSMKSFGINEFAARFPNALLEAAYLGVPIVVSNFAGIEDYCENDKNALIVPVGDAKATADAISSILSNKKLAMRLSKGAIKLAKQIQSSNN